MRFRSLFGLAVLLVALLAPAGFAAEQGKTITLGESLSEAERNELLGFFDAAPDDPVITVTVDDTKQAMDGIFDDSTIQSAYSSTALTCRDLGDGLDVTTNHITVVTPGLYAMALVTAGIGDATLVVAAPAAVANVQGMTALTGVFKTWAIAPCASGNTSEERQRLALEELTLTVEIGQALVGDGTENGVQLATDIVLDTQQTIVTEHLTDSSQIDEVIHDRELAAGVGIPGDLRGDLVDLMTRLANTTIDWSTFSAGWTIERPAPNQITMRGDGIAIRNAQASATAQAAANQTATAAAAATGTARAQLTATVRANATATAHAAATTTANAQLTATADANATANTNALATEQANVALTATAEAQPTATPTPLPTATPAPFDVAGKIVAVEGDTISVAPADTAGTPIAYTVDDAATITRGGTPAAIETISKGDLVSLTVDGNTRQVTALLAQPAPSSLLGQLAVLGWILPAILLVPAVLWYRKSIQDVRWWNPSS